MALDAPTTPLHDPASHRSLRAEFGAAVEPIVELRTGRVQAVEVLLRPRYFGSLSSWRSSNGPSAAERLTLLSLETAARSLRTRPVRVHVNVTPSDLARPSLPQLVRSVVEPHLLDRLVLEVTEEFPWTDRPAILRTIAQLREQGVQFALDDFGEGWSNFEVVRLLRPEVLKVTTAIVGPGAHRAFAEVALDVAAAVGARCVLERIEDDATAAWAAAVGFDLGQGWLWDHGAAP